jgi:CelD/BcsL family acetyltransferase involved in cellulose biosynthesis
MAALNTFVLRSIGEVQAIAAEWQALLDRSERPEIFSCCDWLTAWWEVFGQDLGCRLLVIGVRQEGALVGLAPLVVQPVRALGGGRINRLGFMGGGEAEPDEVCSDFPDLIAARGYEAAVGAEVWRRLLQEGPAWDEGRWKNLLESSTICRYWRPIARDGGLSVEAQPTGERFFVDLSQADFGAYLDGLSKNKKKRILYYRRRMEKEGGLQRQRVTTAEEIPTFLGEIARLNRQRQGEKGELSAWQSAKFREFHLRVAPRLLARGWLDLRVWRKEGRCVAAIYNMVYGGTIYYYQSGFDTAAFGNVSPGLLTLSEVIEWGFEQRLQRFDFLVGNEGSYKEDYGCQTQPVLDLRVYNTTWKGQLSRSATGVRRLWRALTSARPRV